MDQYDNLSPIFYDTHFMMKNGEPKPKILENNASELNENKFKKIIDALTAKDLPYDGHILGSKRKHGFAHDSEDTKLKTHIAFIHEGKKEFRCDTCPSSFHDRDYLDKHISLVHEGRKDSNNVTIQPMGEGSKSYDQMSSEPVSEKMDGNVIKTNYQTL